MPSCFCLESLKPVYELSYTPQYAHNLSSLTCGLFLSVLMDDHKEDEAIAELSRAIGFKPDLQLLHLRAAFHDSMGDYISTVRDCEAALCLDPSHAETLELCNKARERINEQK